MRDLLTTALLSFVLTVVAAASLRADDAAVSVGAVAAASALVALVAAWNGREADGRSESGQALAGTVPLVVLVLGRRHDPRLILPLLTAQVVGAVLGGLAALALETPLGGTLVWTTPDTVAVAALSFVVGVVAGWVTLAVDGGESPVWSAVPAVVAGATLSLGLAAAASPAVLIGLGVAGLLGWLPTLVAAAAVLVGAVLALLTTSLVSRDGA